MEKSWRLIRAVARGNNNRARYLSNVINSAPEKHSCSDYKKFLVEMDMSYKDGFTCLESECKLCSVNSPGNLYINKTTGFFTCVRCKTYGEWTGLRKLLRSVSTKAVNKEELAELKSPLHGVKLFPKEPTFKETLTAVHTKDANTVRTLMQQFNLPDTDSEVLEQLGVCVDSSGSSLFFPFRTIDNLVAGYRVIKRKTGEETTLLGADQSGLIIFYPEQIGRAHV